MIRRMTSMIAVVVVLMGNLSAYAASTLTFNCNSNPPLNLKLISFSFDVERPATTRGGEPNSHKVKSMTIRFPISENGAALHHILTTNELLKACQLTEGTASQGVSRKEAVNNQIFNQKEVVTNQAISHAEITGATEEWAFKNVRVIDLKTILVEATGGKGANSSSKEESWQATLTYEEVTSVRK